MSSQRVIRRVAFQVRTAVSLWWGLLVAAAYAALVSRGFFEDLRSSGADTMRLTAAAALGALLLARVVGRLRIGEPEEEPVSSFIEASRDFELGLLVVVGTHVLLQLAGGVLSPVYPITYAMVTFLVAYNRVAIGVTLVAISLGLEALALLQAGTLARHAGLLGGHVAFSVFFGTVSLALLRVEVAKLRREHRARLQAEIHGMRQEAKDFRLISATLTQVGSGRSRDEQEQHLFHGAVESIHQSLYFSLELLKDTLHVQSCVLLWLDDRGETLSIKEMVTDSDFVQEAPFPAVSGVLGGVVKNRTSLAVLQPGAKGVPYYAGPATVGAFLGVPVLEAGHLRGVLCLDRAEAQAFTAEERDLLEEAARHLVHTVQAERMFCAVERSKYEQERFFKATELLNSAVGLQAVCSTAFLAVREIVDFDHGALTLLQNGRHTIVATSGEALAEYQGHSYADNAGLVAMAIKNRHFLPAGGELRDRHQLIFAKPVTVPAVESLLVYPLISGDEALGAFVIAARARGLFTPDRRELLGVIANQVAVSVQNALRYEQLDALATTDRMTGLVNKGALPERFKAMLERARRTRKPVSVLLTDIDHFKSVNDTYGHQVGDEVLKTIAAVLKNQARTIDVVARWGGEEFVLVLEDTDGRGALKLAERIREEVARLTHASDQGPFQRTMSIGVSVFPSDDEDMEVLVKKADQALYYAKEHGRNQVVLFETIR
jgi:diguanylate cyclase (GGDEF)-like protein